MPEGVSDRLRKARLERGYETASDAARAFGFVLPTYVSHENGTRNITRAAARRYAASFGVSPGWLMGLSEDVQAQTQLVQLAGEAAWGVWREKTLDPYQSLGKLNVSVPLSGGRNVRFAVKICDDSVNRSISPNDIAICEHHPISVLPEIGRLYYIERIRGDLVEKTVRLAARSDDGAITFRAHSTAPLYAGAVFLIGKDETVNVVGLVVGKYSPL